MPQLCPLPTHIQSEDICTDIWPTSLLCITCLVFCGKIKHQRCVFLLLCHQICCCIVVAQPETTFFGSLDPDVTAWQVFNNWMWAVIFFDFQAGTFLEFSLLYYVGATISKVLREDEATRWRSKKKGTYWYFCAVCFFILSFTLTIRKICWWKMLLRMKGKICAYQLQKVGLGNQIR